MSINYNSHEVTAILAKYKETTSTASISSNVLTINLNNSNIFLVTLNANITTLTISNPASSGTAHGFSIIFTADGTVRTITWPASVKWPGGTAPTMTGTNNKRDILNFMTTDGGTNWFAFIGGQNF